MWCMRPGGFVLTETQLSATLTPSISGQPVYTPALGGKLDAGTHTLRAEVAATTEREAANATVPLVVKKATPDIRLRNNASRQEVSSGQGVALALDDVLEAVTPSDAAVTLDPPAGTVLPPGTYRVQAHVAGDKNLRAGAAEARFTVTAGTV